MTVATTAAEIAMMFGTEFAMPHHDRMRLETAILRHMEHHSVLARELLKQALGDLDTIAAEPAPHEKDSTLVRTYRVLAADGAQMIRDRLRAGR